MPKATIQAIFQIIAVLIMFYGVYQLAVVVIGFMSMQSQLGSISVSVGGLSGTTKIAAITASALPFLAGFLLYAWAPVFSRNIYQSCQPRA